MAHIITLADTSPKDVVTRNWRYLYDRLQAATAALEFNAEEESTPRTRLVKARIELRKAEARIIEQRITRLGKFKVRSEIGFVINSVKGMRQGLIDKELTKKQLNNMLPTLTARLRTVAMEITVRADKEAQDVKVHNAHVERNERVSALPEQAPQKAAKAKTPTTANIYKDINDAMRSLREKNEKQLQKEREEIKRQRESKEKRDEEELRMALDRHSTEQEQFPGAPPVDEDFTYLRNKERHTKYYVKTPKELKDEAEDAKNRQNRNWSGNIPDSPNLWEVRDINTLNDIKATFDKELVKIKADIKKAAIHNNTGSFVMLRGPVALIANPGPGERQMERSGLKYKMISTPATQLGANPGGQREPTRPVLILLDQVLIAIGIKPPAKVKPKAPGAGRIPVIPPMETPKKAAKSSTYDPENIDLLRDSLADTLSMKLGGDWMDILKENQAKTGQFIIDKNFPHTRFVWFIKRSAFNKLAPIKIQQIGFPFSGS